MGKVKDEAAAAAEESTEVATTEEQLPAEFLEQAKADAGAGNESIGVDDVGLPYISILQTMSPQVDPDKSAYIEGAVKGMMHNNITNETYDTRDGHIEIVCCGYERKYVEWVHRDQGGGWVADYPITSDILQQTRPDDKGKPRMPNGNIIVETAYHYVWFRFVPVEGEPGPWKQGVIAMKSTGLKKNRLLNNLIVESKIPGTDTQAPRWMHVYTVKTVLEEKGENAWMNFDIKQDRMVNQSLYTKGKEFHDLFAAGTVKRSIEGDDGDIIDPETGEVLQEGKKTPY